MPAGSEVEVSHRTDPFRESIWLVVDTMFDRHPDMIFFGNGAPAKELMPADRLREAAAKAWLDDEALGYGESAGYLPLRETISKRMAAMGAIAAADEIIVVNGSQEGIDIIGRALLEPGDIALVEGPTFPDTMRLLASYDAELIGLPLDEDGLIVDELRALLDRLPKLPKLLYTIPTFQNPSGVTMSLARRRQLVDLARERNVLLVEDDPYSAFRYDGESLPSLKELHPETVYLGTFSKTIAPGLRVGWIAAKRPLYDTLSAIKEAVNISNDRMMTRTVHAAAEGFLDDHIARVRESYRNRRDALMAALEEYMPPSATWIKPEGGFFVWIDLPEDVDTGVLLEQAAAAGVIFLPGDWFFPDHQPKNGLRLSFSALPEDRMTEGVKRLAGVLMQQL